MKKRSSKSASVIETFRTIGKQLWFAQLQGKPQTKCRGKTQVEAVGRLIVAKHRLLRLDIVRDHSQDTGG